MSLSARTECRTVSDGVRFHFGSYPRGEGAQCVMPLLSIFERTEVFQASAQHNEAAVSDVLCPSPGRIFEIAAKPPGMSATFAPPTVGNMPTQVKSVR